MRPRASVLAFADAMEEELQENDHKGGWSQMPARALFRHLRAEVAELGQEIARTPIDPTRVRSEAADVGNLAMMIADVCGGLGRDKAAHLHGIVEAAAKEPKADVVLQALHVAGGAAAVDAIRRGEERTAAQRASLHAGDPDGAGAIVLHAPPDVAALEQEIDDALESLGANVGETLAATIARVIGEMQRVCVAILATDTADRILLIRHRRRGTWELPGGKKKQKPAETWRDAARREAREETGLEVVLDDGPPYDVLDGQPVSEASYASTILIVRASAEGEPTPGDDAADARWFGVDQIPWGDLSQIGSAEIVRRWANGG